MRRAGEDDMPLEEAVQDAERQTYYKGYLESMVTAVSVFSRFRFLIGKGAAAFLFRRGELPVCVLLLLVEVLTN